MLTNREMVNFQKWDFFRFFLYTFTINRVTEVARKMPIEYMFGFDFSEQCIKLISLHKKIVFFSSVFKKIISNDATPTFQEVGVVTEPIIFCRWHNNFSWYRVYHNNTSNVFYFFVRHCFQN